MKKNMGTADRIIRTILAIVIAVLYFFTLYFRFVHRVPLNLNRECPLRTAENLFGHPEVPLQPFFGVRERLTGVGDPENRNVDQAVTGAVHESDAAVAGGPLNVSLAFQRIQIVRDTARALECKPVVGNLVLKLANGRHPPLLGEVRGNRLEHLFLLFCERFHAINNINKEQFVQPYLNVSCG